MFVTKKKYEELRKRKVEKDREYVQYMSDMQTTLEKTQAKVRDLLADNERLKSNLLDRESTETSFSVTFSEDVQTATPITRVNPKSIKKLVEAGFLPFNKQDDELAIQLSVMLASSDALEQIIYSYEQELDDVEPQGGSEDAA